MGLDIVELVMEVEEEFEIVIKDCDAQQITTMGELHAYISVRTGTQRLEYCATSRTFYRLRRALMSGFELARKQVSPVAHMEDLITRQSRRDRWRVLAEALGGWKLPSLKRPEWVFHGMVLLTAVMFLTAVLGFSLYRLDRALAVVAFGAAAASAALLTLAMPATERLAVEFPSDCAEVGGLVRVLLRQNYGRLVAEAGGFPRDDVWVRLCKVVSENLGIDQKELTPDSRFVEDLGAG